MGVAAVNYIYNANQISYSNQNSTITDVKGALDELYNKTVNSDDIIDSRFGGFSVTYQESASAYAYETIYNNKSYGIILNTLATNQNIVITSNNAVDVTEYSKLKITYLNFTDYLYGTEFMLVQERTTSSSPIAIKTTGRVNAVTTHTLCETEIDLSDVNQSVYLAIRNLGSGTYAGTSTHIIGIQLIV